MRYLVFSASELADQYTFRLTEQLAQTDIRSEFKVLNLASNQRMKIVRSFAPDFFIQIGTLKSNPGLLLYAQRHGFRTCFLSINDQLRKDDLKKKIVRKADLIFLTIPTTIDASNQFYYIGNPLVDFLKDYDFDSKFSLTESEVNIVISLGQVRTNRTVKKVVKKLSSNNPTFKFHFLDQESNYLNEQFKGESLSNIEVHSSTKYDLMKQCNLSITSSDRPCLESTLLNCPQVVFLNERKGLFKKKKPSILINTIAGREVVKVARDADEIDHEMNMILNDQNYCANMLAEYQVIKNKIGHERAFKNAARIIVDFLESSSA